MLLRRVWIWFGLVSAVTLNLPANARSENLFALTPEHFTTTAQLKDDALETKASFSTYNGWRERPSDVFLRAFVDKRPGEVEYQLYASVSTKGDWQFYDRINYQAPDQTVKEGRMIRVGSDVSCGAVRYGGRCTVYEDAIFIVEESLLRSLADLYAPGRQVAWQFKLKGKYIDGDYTNGIVPAEAAGLLAAVDRYRASRGLTGPSSAKAAQPKAEQPPPAPEVANSGQPPAAAKPPAAPKKKRPAVSCITCQ